MNIEKAKPLIEYIQQAGRRLVEKSGKIADIGIKKKYLTEEDIQIERDIKRITDELTPGSSFFAEEEHDYFIKNDDVWVCDPISGTRLFINGLPHYAIVVSHINKGKVDFAVVHDPSTGDLYWADGVNGAFKNDTKLTMSRNSGKKIIHAAHVMETLDQDTCDRWSMELQKSGYEVFPSYGSYGLNYCAVASGLYGGLVSHTNDAFPEFAGCFIANMAGYKATNIDGSKDINPADRRFVCGADNYKELLAITQSVLDIA